MRGHSESVNHVGFVPKSDLLFSCSGDKTVAVWDIRTGLCEQTLFGHENAVNHGAISLDVSFSNQGFQNCQWGCQWCDKTMGYTNDQGDLWRWSQCCCQQGGI
jgi:WD40 repeat protein